MPQKIKNIQICTNFESGGLFASNLLLLKGNGGYFCQSGSTF